MAAVTSCENTLFSNPESRSQSPHTIWSMGTRLSIAVLLVCTTGGQAEVDGKTLVCDKRDRAITYVFCRDLHFTLMFSGLLQKDLLKGKRSLAKSYFK